MKQQLTGMTFSDFVYLRADHCLKASVVFSSMVGELLFPSASILCRNVLTTIQFLIYSEINCTQSLECSPI